MNLKAVWIRSSVLLEDLLVALVLVLSTWLDHMWQQFFKLMGWTLRLEMAVRDFSCFTSGLCLPTCKGLVSLEFLVLIMVSHDV